MLKHTKSIIIFFTLFTWKQNVIQTAKHSLNAHIFTLIPPAVGLVILLSFSGDLHIFDTLHSQTEKTLFSDSAKQLPIQVYTSSLFAGLRILWPRLMSKAVTRRQEKWTRK